MSSDQAKLFVGGISWETNEDVLKEHFQSYGTVSGSVVAKNRFTQSPRGFGFVWFSDISSAEKALKEKHVILGRTVEVKKAVPRVEKVQSEQQNREAHKNGRIENANDQSRARKIFVGGLSANLTEDEFRDYFEKFGRITDVVVMHDSLTNRPRGFGFITFDSVESVDTVMQNNFHELNGRRVEVKRAVPKEGNFTAEHASNPRIRGGNGSPFNINYPIYYPYYGSSYEVYPNYTPLPYYGGLRADIYGSTCPGSLYPVGLYSGGHEITPMTQRLAFYDPKFMGVRMFPSTYTYSYPQARPEYSSEGARLSDAVAGDGIADEEANVKENQTIQRNGDESADAVSTQIEEKA